MTEPVAPLDARALVSEIRHRRCTRIGATGCRSLSLGMWCDACLLTAVLGLIEQQQEALKVLEDDADHHRHCRTCAEDGCGHGCWECQQLTEQREALAGARAASTEGDTP
jgi:hypothetical protein